MDFRRLFSGERRTSRKRYWLSFLIAIALFWASFIIPGGIAFIVDKLGMNSGFLKYLPGIVWFMQVIPLCLFMRGVIAGRLLDANVTGCKFHILWFIPVFGWLIALTLLGIFSTKPKTEAEEYLDELENSKSSIDDG